MNLFSNKFSFIKFIFLLLVFVGFKESTFKASTIKKENLPISIDKIREIEQSSSKTPYILDSGDILKIVFIDLIYFDGSYPIDTDGYLHLPELKKVFVKGISKIECEKLLNKMYEDYIKEPDVRVSIIQRRPVNIFIKGEVNRPGLYQLTSESTNVEKLNKTNYSENLFSPQNNMINERNFINSPKLFNALQLTSGLKKKADLSKIKVIRQNSKLNGGGKIQTEINFLSLLINGDQSQNIELRDGDIIIIPKTENQKNKQFLEITKTNITPYNLKIFVNGNVKNPGPKEVPKNTTLNEAIAYAGGADSLMGKIEFLRFDDSGNLKKNVIKYDINAIKGSKSNPYLIDGDVIMARKNLVGKISVGLEDFGSPLINAYGIYKLFD